MAPAPARVALLERHLPKAWYFLSAGSTVFLLPYLYPFFDSVGFGDAQLGVISALRPWLAAAASFALPALGDRLGCHKALMLVTFVAAAGLRLALWPLRGAGFVALLVVVLASDFLAAPAGVLADALVVAAADRGGGSYGGQRLWGSVGWGGLAFGAGALLDAAGYGASFLMYGALTVPAVLVLMRLKYDSCEVSSAETEARGTAVAEAEQHVEEKASLLRGDHLYGSPDPFGGPGPQPYATPLSAALLPLVSRTDLSPIRTSAGGVRLASPRGAPRSLASPFAAVAAQQPPEPEALHPQPATPFATHVSPLAPHSRPQAGPHHLPAPGQPRRSGLSGPSTRAAAALPHSSSSPSLAAMASGAARSHSPLAVEDQQPQSQQPPQQQQVEYPSEPHHQEQRMQDADDNALGSSQLQQMLRHELIADFGADSGLGSDSASGGASPFQPLPPVPLPEWQDADGVAAVPPPDFAAAPSFAAWEASRRYAASLRRPAPSPRPATGMGEAEGEADDDDGEDACLLATRLVTNAAGYPTAATISQPAPTASTTAFTAPTAPTSALPPRLRGSAARVSWSGVGLSSWSGTSTLTPAPLTPASASASSLDLTRDGSDGLSLYHVHATTGFIPLSRSRRSMGSMASVALSLSRASSAAAAAAGAATADAGARSGSGSGPGAKARRGSKSLSGGGAGPGGARPGAKARASEGTGEGEGGDAGSGDSSPSCEAACCGRSAGFLRRCGTLLSSSEVWLFLAKVYLLGFGAGLIGTWLLIYVAELGASHALQGLMLMMNCVAEVPVFACQQALAARVSTTAVLHASLGALVLRLAAYAALPALPGVPWVVLPVELLHGFTFAMCWGASAVHCKRVAPPELQATMQGLMQAVWNGVASGSGGLVGALLHDRLGPTRMWAVLSAGLAAGWAVLAAVDLALALRSRRRRCTEIAAGWKGGGGKDAPDDAECGDHGAVRAEEGPVVAEPDVITSAPRLSNDGGGAGHGEGEGLLSAFASAARHSADGHPSSGSSPLKALLASLHHRSEGGASPRSAPSQPSSPGPQRQGLLRHALSVARERAAATLHLTPSGHAECECEPPPPPTYSEVLSDMVRGGQTYGFWVLLRRVSGAGGLSRAVSRCVSRCNSRGGSRSPSVVSSRKDLTAAVAAAATAAAGEFTPTAATTASADAPTAGSAAAGGLAGASSRKDLVAAVAAAAAAAGLLPSSAPSSGGGARPATGPERTSSDVARELVRDQGRDAHDG
ncbi:hypothetical protein HYH03_018120 [Edaphochlamys debaryana]|uniref:Major facilitator superfamily associated domain-containing protein n=1 Tax=Edaphochlamys debaryana TaxID=47281 RepID=A0A836BNF9_9CHLO|nr:hypothetical protein HYH03_018120 [Edaphochlamys debaryana]|eukprot:KAG2482995.1 hypothetical protein HYH03_018120 [Edaphochlamys debaryana]